MYREYEFFFSPLFFCLSFFSVNCGGDLRVYTEYEGTYATIACGTYATMHEASSCQCTYCGAYSGAYSGAKIAVCMCRNE